MKIFLCLLYMLSASLFLNAQDINDHIKSLQLNSSPAYVVLGVEPENIQRPNSPTDFMAGVQSAVVNGRLQPNFAMETSPYYWGKNKKGNKRFSPFEFLLSNNYGENLARSISFSFATSPSDTFTFGNLKSGTGLGIGMHMQLLQGHVSNNVKENMINLFYRTRMLVLANLAKQALEADRPIYNIDAWTDETIEANGSLKTMPEEKKQELRILFVKSIGKKKLLKKDLDVLTTLLYDVEKKAEANAEDINKYKFPLTREGFMLELAVANASIAEGSEWDKLQGAKTSIWLTPSYRFNVNKYPEVTDFIDIMAVARITFNSRQVDSSNYIDAGGKLQWIHNRLSLSGEGIYRYLSDKPDSVKKNHTFRTAFTLSYKLNEVITFQATFGSNFNGNSTTYSDPSKMFAVGGFNFGFSNFFKKENN